MNAPETYEVIMKISMAGTNGYEIVAHAEKISELIRCKDCKFWSSPKMYKWEKTDDGYAPRYTAPYCALWESDVYTSEDDYCSQAERRME